MRPSCSQSTLNGRDAVGADKTTSLPPSGSTATISCAPQLQTHRRPSHQRGDSGNARPLNRTLASDDGNALERIEPSWIYSVLQARCSHISEPGVVRSSPVSSKVLIPERTIGQPPYS